MKIRRVLLISLSLILLFPLAAMATDLEPSVSKDALLLKAGYPQEVLQLNDIQKDEIVNFIKSHPDYTISHLKNPNDDEYTIQSNSNLNTFLTVASSAEYPNTSTSQYKDILVSGGLKGNVNSKSVGAGAAWSGQWNIVKTFAYASWRTKNFLGVETTHTADSILVDAAAQKGVTYSYDGIPSNGYYAGTSLLVTIKKPLSSHGSFDVVGKQAYTTSSVNWSATISSTPGITFGPSDKVYQRAAIQNVNY
ncbi:hypothetical protein SAMN05720606_106228 [Paenibacillus polysaccharolyticus]|uniref:Uncharacterized protein n=1 Tax=Paenibacillus polysaccharolyticus TaxID=582692 RepID=A0A1G5H5R1_9BACL|nr:hypothetical protein [Paenibacillus polysaccharolyticus]SCY59064.1 hypothetical protein SAMN05720606_106228 [Paenibacillus polysaccharolyticus]